jgi:dolichyl-phosphate-mannose-protein mannosyltransferase
VFGLTPFGWRFAVAVAGSLAILILARTARRMTRSTLLGCVAGLLLALDGLEFVMSRTALLDIFVMFWVLAAFGLLVIDRDVTRARLADAADQLQPAAFEPPGGEPESELDLDSPPARLTEDERNKLGGPKLGVRWLRVLAGVCLGAACASKWNAIWFVFAFGCLAIAWDLGARHAAGFKDRLYGVLRSDTRWLPVWFGVVPAVVYALTWTGWFVSSNGYDRNWAAQNGNHTPIWGSIDSWYQYNKWMLQFGLGLNAPKQPYKSNPIGWLVLQRPISMYWSEASHSCGAKTCASEVLAVGTPAIWWGATLALLFCLGWWLWRLIGDLALSRPAQRDWRAGAVLLTVAAGWLPWVWFYLHDHRTEFFYYAIAFDPFLVIAITLCLGMVIGPSAASSTRRAVGAVVAGGYMIIVLLNFAYLFPILTAEIIPYSDWLSRMWFHSWI